MTPFPPLKKKRKFQKNHVVFIEPLSHVQLSTRMDCDSTGSADHVIFQGKYWRELPCPTPGHLPDPGTEPSPELASDFFTIEPRGESKGPSWEQINQTTENGRK